MALTPEDLAKLKALRAGTVPPTEIDPPQMSPQAAADPYNKRAEDYNTQAAGLEKQALQPQPEPKGPKEQLIASLRNAMENMGRWGAPGGYYGQEEQRTQDFQKENAMRLSQAKNLRDVGEKQSQLGVNAENVARQENYNQGQLAETAKLRQRQDAQEQETARHNQVMEEKDNFASGPNDMVYSKKTGNIVNQPMAKDVKPQKQQGTLHGEPFFANYTGGKFYSPETGQDISADFKPFVPGANSGGSEQVVQSGDAFNLINKKTATSRPVVQKDGAPLAIEATAQERNRAGQAKIIDTYADHVMALIDADPSAVGPLLGRISRGEIKIGDAPANVRQLYTALTSFEALQPILHGFRGGSQTVDHFHKAIGGMETNAAGLKASISEIKMLAQQIRTGVDGGTPADAAAPASGGLPNVGSTFNGAKVLKVTPIQ